MRPNVFLTRDDFNKKIGNFNWSRIKINEIIKNKKIKGGKGVKVAIIDSGIDIYHEDLKNSVSGGVNFTTETSSDYIDRYGHGTFCSGIIAGSDNKIGITGISPNVELYSVKVINDLGLGKPDWATAGIEWCIDHDIDIVNLSFEDKLQYKPMELAIKRAIKKGIILVAAAGNLGDGMHKTSELLYPAMYPEVISVSAHDKMLEHANFNATNIEVDICAPGVNILSCFPRNLYCIYSGTSMAAPFITGVIALLKGEHPDIAVNEIDDILNKISIEKGLPGKDAQFGWGIISPEHIFDLLEN